jgi:putative copper resistance protein D
MSGGPEPLLVAARFLALITSLALFGSACFSVYAGAPPGPRRPSAIGWSASAAAPFGVAAWLAALTHEMTGAAGLPGPEALVSVVAETEFGRALAIAFVCSLLLMAAGARGRARGWPGIVVSGVLLCCLAMVGHAASGIGTSGLIRKAAMAVHLLAAGVWLGGLPALFAALRRRKEAAPQLLAGFSRMAVLAVLLAVGSGLISLLYVVLTAGGTLGPAYLRALGTKLALVAALLIVAGLNRFWLTPRIINRPQATLQALRVAIAVEQAAAAALVGAVAWLGQLDPST